MFYHCAFLTIRPSPSQPTKWHPSKRISEVVAHWRHFAHPSPKFYREEKVHNLASKIEAKCTLASNGAIYLNWIWTLEVQMIGLCQWLVYVLKEIWCSSVCSPLRTIVSLGPLTNRLERFLKSSITQYYIACVDFCYAGVIGPQPGVTEATELFKKHFQWNIRW